MSKGKELTDQQGDNHEAKRSRWGELLGRIGETGDNLLGRMANALMSTHETIGNLYQGTVELTANSAIATASNMLNTYDSLFGFTGIEKGLGLSEAERDVLLKRLIATHIVSRVHAPLAKGALGAMEDFLRQRASTFAQPAESRELIIHGEGRQRSYIVMDMIEQDVKKMIEAGVRTELQTEGYSEDRIEEIGRKKDDLDMVATELFTDLIRKRDISSFDDINRLINDLIRHTNSHRKEVRRIVNRYRVKTQRDEVPETNLISWLFRRGR